ncbi:hypothetical protein IJ732_08395 [bacterium]|nr:hypothetical protein [bacterium]
MTDLIRNFGIKTGHHHQEKTSVERIKDETLKKLEELGIDTSNIHTETEAQMKIKEAESATAAQIDPHLFKEGQIDPMQQAFADAKDLAERLGIKPGEMKNIAELIKNIDNQITNLEQQISDNKEQQEIVQSLREEFAGLSSTYNQAQQGQAKISEDMGLLASYNKLNSSVEIGSVTREQILSIQKPQHSENSQNSKQDSENNERNPERIGNRFNSAIPNQNETEKKEPKEVEDTSFLGQIKEKLGGGIFKKSDALKPIDGEAITDRQIFNKAKELANQVGLPADNTVGLNELLYNINNRISKIESEQEDKNIAFNLRQQFNTIYNNYMSNH